MDYADVLRKAVLVNILRKTAMRGYSGGLPCGQVKIVKYIIDHDGCTQREIAEQFHITPASVTLTTKRLVAKECITKQADATNARCNRLSVTEKGKRIYEEGRSYFDKLDQSMYNGFSDEELKQLDALYDKIIYNLTGEKQEITPQKFSEFVDRLRAVEEKNGKKRKSNK